MEICCLEECGADSVRPVLVAPRFIDNPLYHPCLPACTKTYYCCDKPPKPKHCHRHCIKAEHEPCPPPNNYQDCYIVRSPSPSPRPLCCEPCESHHECKPTKTKYIMPCYRYEDGRIANQPTLLMRRACEVAVGKRPRKKPYEESRFVRDADCQESRYIREDEEGNCCFHFEHQKNKSALPSALSQYCMEYPPGVTARPVMSVPAVPQSCYYYSSYNPC